MREIMKKIIYGIFFVLFSYHLPCLSMEKSADIKKPLGQHEPLFTDEELQEEQKKLNTALFDAVDKCDFTEIPTLIDQGANVNACGNFKRTPLHEAIANYSQKKENLSGDLCTIMALLVAKANPDAQDNNGQTPLHYTVGIITPGVLTRTYFIIKMLLAHGADKTIRDHPFKLCSSDPQHQQGLTPLEYAKMRWGSRLPQQIRKLLT